MLPCLYLLAYGSVARLSASSPNGCVICDRSEERRVGKEGGSGGWWGWAWVDVGVGCGDYAL